MAIERESHRHSERYTQEIAMQLIISVRLRCPEAKLALFEVFKAHRSSRYPWRWTPKGESGSTADALYAQAVVRMYSALMGEVPAPIS
eukprot:gene3431-4312_t